MSATNSNNNPVAVPDLINTSLPEFVPGTHLRFDNTVPAVAVNGLVSVNTLSTRTKFNYLYYADG